MDIVARAQPVVEEARQEMPNLKDAVQKIVDYFRNIWAKIMDTGLLNSFFSRISEFFAGATSAITSSTTPTDTAAPAPIALSEKAAPVAPGEKTSLLAKETSLLGKETLPPPV